MQDENKKNQRVVFDNNNNNNKSQSVVIDLVRFRLTAHRRLAKLFLCFFLFFFKQAKNNNKRQRVVVDRTPGSNSAPNHTRPRSSAHCNQHLDYVTKESLSSTIVWIISRIVCSDRRSLRYLVRLPIGSMDLVISLSKWGWGQCLLPDQTEVLSVSPN